MATVLASRLKMYSFHKRQFYTFQTNCSTFVQCSNHLRAAKRSKDDTKSDLPIGRNSLQDSSSIADKLYARNHSVFIGYKHGYRLFRNVHVVGDFHISCTQNNLTFPATKPHVRNEVNVDWLSQTTVLRVYQRLQVSNIVKAMTHKASRMEAQETGYRHSPKIQSIKQNNAVTS